jgi:DNA-binding MarR family transcriptional regulator
MTEMIPGYDDPDNATGDSQVGRFLTFRLARVQAKLNAQAGRVLKEQAGLTLTQWRLVSLIGGNGRTTAAHLSREAAIDKGLISRNIKQLSEAGLVRITVDPDDHRAQNLELTDRGVNVFQTTLPRMRARQDALRAHLNTEEEEVLLSALEKLERAADDRSLG